MDGFEMSIVINRRIEEVFAFLSNLENDAKWRREWVDAKKTSEGPVSIGSRFSLFSEMFGKRNEVVYEVANYEPNHIAAWKTISGPLPLKFQRTFEQVEGGTQISFRYEAERDRMPFIFKLLKPLIVGAGKRALQGDFPKLKELMEAHDL